MQRKDKEDISDKKTWVNLEAHLPSKKKEEDYRRKKQFRRQPKRNPKKRNRDALSPPTTTDARKGDNLKHLRLSKPNGEPTNFKEGKVSKLLRIFENNEEDIQSKQKTRLFSGFESKKREDNLIGQELSPSEMKSNGRGGQQSPLN